MYQRPFRNILKDQRGHEPRFGIGPLIDVRPTVAQQIALRECDPEYIECTEREEVELTPHQVEVLELVRENPGLTTLELAKVAGVYESCGRSNLRCKLDRLVTKGVLVSGDRIKNGAGMLSRPYFVSELYEAD